MIVKQAQVDCEGTGFVFVSAARGVFRGGAIGPWPPPFGSPGQYIVDIVKYNKHRIVCKIAAWFPPFVSWAEALSTQRFVYFYL